MQNLKINSPLKIGLLLATLSWFSYIFYDFNIGVFSRHTSFPGWIEDFPSAWGFGFRTVAAFMAILIVILFVFRREFSRVEAVTAFRFVVLFEAIYFASFLGGGLNVWKKGYFTIHLFLEQGLPCIVMGILIPVVLIELFFALNPKKPLKDALKWALIYVSSFIFVFWLNNTGYWLGTVDVKGLGYITQYPINMLSFVVTIVGLLLLLLYAADFSSKWVKTNKLENLNLRKIGLATTFLGLYSLFIYLLWLFFGSVGGWSTWYAWFLGHGYMTFIAFPITFISLPLLFKSLTDSEGSVASQNPNMLTLSKNQLDGLLFFAQALGVAFFTVFSLAYYIPIPSRNFLIATQPYYSLQQIFGTLFFIIALLLVVLSFAAKIKPNSSVAKKTLR